MKNLKLFEVYLLFQLMVLTSYSQDIDSTKEVQIDPRQYVTVMYHKSFVQSNLDIIWNWEDQNNIPNQKFKFLDIDGEIKIIFNRKDLTANPDFEGTISLEAEISGNGGTRKIEVNPYSEIGIPRIPIGIKSEPPAEISKKLLNLLLRELRDASENYNDTYSHRLYPEREQVKESLDKLINEIERLCNEENIEVDVLKGKVNHLYRLINSNDIAWADYYFLSARYDFSTIKTKEEFLIKFYDLETDYNELNNSNRDYFVETYKKALIYDNQKTEIVLDYLNSFESAGEDAIKAFLSLINLDIIQYRVLKDGLIRHQSNLKAINISNYQQNYSRLDTILQKNYELILECSKNLYELSNYKGSILDKIIQKTARDNNIRNIDIDSVEGKYPENFSQKEKDILKNKINREYNKFTDTYFDDISSEMTNEAGKIIYKKLIYALIDLGKSGSKSGDVLNLYITWILDSRRDSLAKSPRLPLGKYYLRETGWRLEVTDMFSLVKRINEPKNDSSAVSPTNFKGSGGAVLLWSYNKEDKGISITEDKLDPSVVVVKRKNRFWNFLEPSIGLNVSYLDFSTKKDVEIGTGLQVGIFHNKIFFGYGINLHMLSPRESPYYYYLGFSFAKLSDFFVGNKSVNAVQ